MGGKSNGPPYNEDQQLELEALQAIFMDDFQGEDGGVFSIMVVPFISGLELNHVQIKFSVRFPEAYPEVPLTARDCDIEMVKGGLGKEVAAELKDLVVREAEKLVGQQMVYLLIEKLKEHLELYNWTVADGAMNVFSDEVLYNVMSYLKAHELAACAMVNRKFLRVSEENSLWEELSRSEKAFVLHERSHPPKEDDIEHGYWKKYYMDMMNLIAPPFTFMAAIVGRKGTNDEWYSHFGSWKTYYAEELTKYDLALNSRGQITNPQSGLVIGHYKFIATEQVEAKYSKTRWWTDLMKNLEECPYINGLTGFIAFQPAKRYAKQQFMYAKATCQEWIIQAIIQTSRGIIVRTDLDNCYMLCIRPTRIIAGELVNREDDYSELGLVVSPRLAKGTVKYLNDIVEMVNKKINKFLAKESEKKAAKQRGFRTFVESVHPVSRAYYPFQLEDYPIFQHLNEKWLTIWAHPNGKLYDATYDRLVYAPSNA